MYCFNHDHLLDILINVIQNIPSVQDTETIISLDQPIDRTVWVKDKKENKGFHRKEGDSLIAKKTRKKR